MNPGDLIEKCDCGSPAHTIDSTPHCDCGRPATHAVLKQGILQSVFCRLCVRLGRAAS